MCIRDRPDGIDIYELFDHNLACEIRLKDALEEDLLCPFHYFGISDLEIDGKTVEDVYKRQHMACCIFTDYIFIKFGNGYCTYICKLFT